MDQSLDHQQGLDPISTSTTPCQFLLLFLINPEQNVSNAADLGCQVRVVV